MDMKQIKELIASMEKWGLKKIRVKEEKGFELELERHSVHPPLSEMRSELHHQLPSAPSTPHRLGVEESTKEKLTPPVGEYVISPMVGTYYSSPSPEDPSYAKVGDEVEEDTVVCIIEAMKVMNEVKSGKKGKIAEIMVNNADPVEFGTKLFRIV